MLSRLWKHNLRIEIYAILQRISAKRRKLGRVLKRKSRASVLAGGKLPLDVRHTCKDRENPITTSAPSALLPSHVRVTLHYSYNHNTNT